MIGGFALMDFVKQIIDYIPINEQETQDKKVILDYIKLFPKTVLLRDNEVAHITSSGFIMNNSLDKALMIHHNIRNTWAWTGGHADGDTDFLHVAIKEAKEETGIINVTPLIPNIASIDIGAVNGHMRKNRYVNPHLHFSIAYILIVDENEKLKINEDENSGVSWFELDKFNRKYFNEFDVNLYSKLIQKAKQQVV